MSRSDHDLNELIEALQRACGELGPGLGTLTATALVTRALVGLLNERGLLSSTEVRDRALDLADDANMPMAEARAAVERMLPAAVPTMTGRVQ